MKRICSLLLTLVLILGLCACGQKTDAWQEQYDLGMKYLSEGNYEESIIAFTAAIEIEPKKAEAYLGMAEVYIAQNDFDAAKTILEQGYEATGDESLRARLEELDSGNFSDYRGRTRKESSYDGEGNLVWYRIYEYPEDKTYEVTSYDAAGNQTGYAYAAHDGNGNQTAMVNCNQVYGTVDQTIREFDGSGNCVKSTSYTAAGEMSQYTVFTHDAAGNCTRMEYFGPDGTSRGYDLLEYNAAGNCVKRMYFGADGSLTHYQEEEWDEQGRHTETRYYNSDGTLDNYSVQEYDGDRQTAYYSYNGDGTLVRKSVYVYSEKGQLIGENVYDGAGNLIQSTVKE